MCCGHHSLSPHEMLRRYSQYRSFLPLHPKPSFSFYVPRVVFFFPAGPRYHGQGLAAFLEARFFFFTDDSAPRGPGRLFSYVGGLHVNREGFFFSRFPRNLKRPDLFFVILGRDERCG